MTRLDNQPKTSPVCGAFIEAIALDTHPVKSANSLPRSSATFEPTKNHLHPPAEDPWHSFKFSHVSTHPHTHTPTHEQVSNQFRPVIYARQCHRRPCSTRKKTTSPSAFHFVNPTAPHWHAQPCGGDPLFAAPARVTHNRQSFACDTF